MQSAPLSSGGGLWGAFANVASYGKDLTHDIREIVAGVDLSNDKDIVAQDEDLDAYVEDLERTLIRKKQEAEAAYKKIEELEAKLAKLEANGEKHDVVKESSQQEQELVQERKAHGVAMIELKTAYDAKLTAKDQEIQRLQDECNQLRVKATTVSNATTEEPVNSNPTHCQVLDDCISALSKVLPSDDLDSIAADPKEVKLTKCIELVSSRLIAFEVDAKALKNTLHAFLLSQNERLNAFNLPECKLKLEEISLARVRDQQKIAQLESSLNKLQASLKEATAASQILLEDNQAVVKELEATQAKLQNARLQTQESDKKDATIKQLNEKILHLQSNIDILSSELEATTNELQEIQALRSAETATLHQDFRAKEESVMDRNNELERLVYSLTEELHQTQEQFKLEKEQWTRHAEANSSGVTEAQWFEMNSRLALLEADKNVAEQDADRLHTELTNLQAVMTQFQSDRSLEESRMRSTIEQLTIQCKSLEEKAASSTKVVANDETNAMLSSALAKKQQECDRLREALDRSASLLHGDTDNVDKRMVIQMMIQYHESPNKSDVLEVMGRILGFTPDDKERLLAHPGRLKSIPLLGSIFGGDSSSSVPPVDVAGKTFSDAWADFLLKEAK